MEKLFLLEFSTPSDSDDNKEFRVALRGGKYFVPAYWDSHKQSFFDAPDSVIGRVYLNVLAWKEVSNQLEIATE